MADDSPTILSIAEECGFELAGETAVKLEKYIDLLLEATRNRSLTSLKDRTAAIRELVIDPLCAFQGGWGDRYLGGSSSLVDVGSGTGSPGAPLALTWSGLELFPLDSVKKKTAFLSEMIAGLGIQGEVLHGRAEDIGRIRGRREKFDLACTKAVGAPSVCLELCLPLLRLGGVYLGMFGADAILEPDARALSRLGGELIDSREYRLPWNDRPRRVFAVKKIVATTGGYPRRAGTPALKPL